jgi:ABC-2 type transport system permease protein
MLAIFKREFKSYFSGLMGYFLTAFLIVVNGIYFVALNLSYGLPDFGYYTLYRTMFVFLIYAPILTMRSLAEEQHSRTDQLLLTSPVTVTDIIVGKFFAMLAVFALPCAAYAVMILTLFGLGASGIATLANFSCLLCYFLLGAAAIALGECVSGLTDNSIIAAASTFALLLLAYLMPSIESMFTVGSAVALIVFVIVLILAALLAGLRAKSLTFGCVTFCVGCVVLVALFRLRGTALSNAFTWAMEKCSLFTPYEDFINQTFSVPALAYYVIVTVLLLFFSCQTLEKRRWN